MHWFVFSVWMKKIMRWKKKLRRGLHIVQGCGLRKITRSPKVPKNEILGALFLSLCEKSQSFELPKGKS